MTNDLQEKSSWALYNRGSAYQEVEDYFKANNDLNVCYRLANALENEFLTANSLNLLGLTYMYQKEYHKARDTFKKIINYEYQSLAASKYLGRAYHNTGRTFFEQENYLEAEKWFEKAVLVKETRKVPAELFISYKALANTLVKNGQIGEAYAIGKKAENQYEFVKLTEGNLKIFKTLREISYTLGNFEASNQYSSKYEEETSKYLQEQQKIFDAKEQFTRDIITAGFFQPQSETSGFSLLNYLLIAIIMLGGITLLIYRYIWMRRKLAITEEIKAINIESNF